jgi:hypothetical protein
MKYEKPRLKQTSDKKKDRNGILRNVIVRADCTHGATNAISCYNGSCV